MSNVLEFLKDHESEVARLLAPKIGCTVAAVAHAIQQATAPDEAAEAEETETPE